jgi:hypothetical protein
MNVPASFGRSVRITTSALSTPLAVAGFHHGFFEALQGNRSCPAMLLLQLEVR